MDLLSTEAVRAPVIAASQENAGDDAVCVEPLSESVVDGAPWLASEDMIEHACLRDDKQQNLLSQFEPRALVRSDPLTCFLAEARRYPRLSAEEERRLAQLARKGDSSAGQKLVLHNLRLVVIIAVRYQRAWTQLIDLIQEGTIGLIEAVRRWEASLGARFGTYAAYWIRAYILHFIMTNARLVSIAHTRAGRKLFFRLEQERRKLVTEGFEATPRLLAARLEVPEEEVTALAGHLEAPEVSIDASVADDRLAIANDLTKREPSPEEVASENEFRSVVNRLMEEFDGALGDERERAVWREHLATEEPVPLYLVSFVCRRSLRNSGDPPAPLSLLARARSKSPSPS